MAKNVHGLIKDLKSGLDDLEQSFQHLGSVFGDVAARGGKKASAARRGIKKAVVVKKVRKKMRMSAALKTQRKLQGRYMGMIRRLPKEKQAMIKKVRETKGYKAALKMMG